ncbi:YraN family protein [Paenibacillus sp. GD4]|jgi:putative endonuclease|uniref:YraN family protein n=1 Tax=Paenibacillus sp. GD4 TaxID=3068890 RepID=UPI0027967120|nr:YraN family protein [Paenibacillus sp. GD4]MDQ1913273.1 YraN family protein [Paenibacillus sp. GD4]
MTEQKTALNRKQLGAVGEQHAEAYLISKHFIILARNWRVRSGEIDIVAKVDGVIVFIEVRTRSRTLRFGTPQESIDAKKQRQVLETAQVYLHQHRLYNEQTRFDVISVITDPYGNLKELDHILCAF